MFLDQKHPQSGRFAILEADADCAWLYLTASGQPQLEEDAFAFSPGPLVTKDEAMAAAKAGAPPPLASEFASPIAVLTGTKPEEFAFKWSVDGESVAVLRNHDPIAMIVTGEKRGFSKALAKSGFYGEPWDQQLYEATFRK